MGGAVLGARSGIEDELRPGVDGRDDADIEGALVVVVVARRDACPPPATVRTCFGGSLIPAGGAIGLKELVEGPRRVAGRAVPSPGSISPIRPVSTDVQSSSLAKGKL